MSSISLNKNHIRIEALAKRERLAVEAALLASEAICVRLIQIVSGSATVLAGYRSIRGEVDVSGALAGCEAMGLRLCLPVVEAVDKPLYFRKWRFGEVLERGRYGVEVPEAGAGASRPDAVLVPLVAFDRGGQRLGYGAGYYDRTIRHLRTLAKRPLMIGVGYSIQEVEQIPVDRFDEKLDMIITEKDVIKVIQ